MLETPFGLALSALCGVENVTQAQIVQPGSPFPPHRYPRRQGYHGSVFAPCFFFCFRPGFWSAPEAETVAANEAGYQQGNKAAEQDKGR